MSLRAILLLPFLAAAAAAQDPFQSAWEGQADRVWIGPEYHANRLQDWRLRGGRVECLARGPRLRWRTLHLLSREVRSGAGDLVVLARVGRAPEGEPRGDGAAGFLVGAGGGRMEPRAAALVHHWAGEGGGLLAGLRADGTLFLLDHEGPEPAFHEEAALARPELLDAEEGVLLVLFARSLNARDAFLSLTALVPGSEEPLGEVSLRLPARRLAGNLALAADPGTTPAAAGGHGWWFRDWRARGSLLRPRELSFGPLAGAAYTVSRGVLKLNAWLTPIGEEDPGVVELWLEAPGGGLERAATAPVERPSFTALFRIPGWEASRDLRFELRTRLKGDAREHRFSGRIRRDPAGEGELVLAAFSCNHNNSHRLGVPWRGDPTAPINRWTEQVWFPHADLTERVAKQDPDLLFFAGDQIYEGKGPTFADFQHLELDYLYKWYLWVWAFRDLVRDRPTVVIPDDHDVYQGNLWGEGGRPARRDHFGGYVRPASFVKMVERTQTAHLPDPVDPEPIEQGIGVWFTDLVWGRVGFALLEDRKFKWGPAGKGLPATGTKRPDHVLDPDFPMASLDLPEAELLGPRQEAFLERWARDWEGQDLKAALSQTPFAGLATHHGPRLEYLRADLDSNGWPPRARDRAVDLLRRAFAVHISGDQHLSTLVHLGIEEHEDAIWSFVTPAIANFYPRAWWPRADGEGRQPGQPFWLGRHRDGFGHPVTVHAVANPGCPSGHEPAELYDGMAGWGIVRFDTRRRTITFEAWPRYADPAQDRPWPGWPHTVSVLDNEGRKPAGFLPAVEGGEEGRTVVLVEMEGTDELVHALRIPPGLSWRPPVYRTDVTWRMHIGDPDRGEWQVFPGLRPDPVSPDSGAPGD